MPQESFFKLDENKRKKIVDAMKKEFSRVSFHEASVNKIVEEAGISKGSFWVYFKSKEEAIEYLIESHLEKERKKLKEILQKNHGDLFQSYVEIYDYLEKSETNPMERNLKANIFKNLITNQEKYIFKDPRDTMLGATKKVINTEHLDLGTDDDLSGLMSMLNYAMRSNLLDVSSGKVTTECARTRFIRQIEILQKGVSKK